METVRHSEDPKGEEGTGQLVAKEQGIRGREISGKESPADSRDSSVSSTRSTSSTRSKRYICEECGKAYARPSVLQQHLMTHTGDKPYKCEECGAAFARKDHLARHKLKHVSSDEKPYHCDICGKGCSTAQHLKRHVKIHEKSFKCPHCDETFFKHQTMKHHINSVHLKNKLTCEYCNKVFMRPYRLSNHKLKQHNESPGYQCTYPGCFKNFKTWSVLTLHMKTDHPKLNCSICGKGCIGLSGLDMHMQVHDEEKAVKLWKCETCDESFLKKEDLSKHACEIQNAGQDTSILTPPGSVTEEPVLPVGEKLLDVLPDAKRRKTAAIPDISVDAMTELISSNVDQRTIPCKYLNCHRLFKKEYDLERHLKWHQVIDKKADETLGSLDTQT